MKPSRFSEEQIIYGVRQGESSTLIGNPCRQRGVSDVSFDSWRKKYVRLGISELCRLRQVEGKRPDSTGRCRPARCRELTAWFHRRFRSVACGLSVNVILLRLLVLAEPREGSTFLRLRIRDLAHAQFPFWYMQIRVMLRREGWLINRKRV